MANVRPKNNTTNSRMAPLLILLVLSVAIAGVYFFYLKRPGDSMVKESGPTPEEKYRIEIENKIKPSPQQQSSVDIKAVEAKIAATSTKMTAEQKAAIEKKLIAH